eukprot:8817668-Ditylum_brightwellii.AAC.1
MRSIKHCHLRQFVTNRYIKVLANTIITFSCLLLHQQPLLKASIKQSDVKHNSVTHQQPLSVPCQQPVM